MKKIYHLSHIDLDGYGCQLVMSYTPYTMISYNANYGAEVLERLKEILEAIKSHKDDATILISDLNLYPDESRMLNKAVQDLCDRGRNINIILLDHHGSGEESAKKYEWYYLDTARCATKIVYDYALENFDLHDLHNWWFDHAPKTVPPRSKLQGILSRLDCLDKYRSKTKGEIMRYKLKDDWDE